MTKHSNLVLLDGSSFVYRAFHASHNNFTTSKGLPTGVTLIMARMLANIVKRFAGAKVIAVFDAKGKSFRNELYAQYKANRPPMPDELKVQLDYVRRITTGFGIPVVSVEGVEADDVLGSYAVAAVKDGYDCVICTGDKDMAQLVNEHVCLFDSMKDVFLDSDAVFAKYGVRPELIIDLLALKGDASDNIPGMSGCGEKTAIALLNGIGSIESIENRLSEIASLSFRGAKNFAPKFAAALPEIRLSYRLATIKTDVPLPLALTEVKEPVADTKALLELYRELEFTRMYSELLARSNESLGEDIMKVLNRGKEQSAESLPAEGEQTDLFATADDSQIVDYKSLGSVFKTVLTKEDLLSLCELIAAAEEVALDTETTSLRPEECVLVGISCAVKEREGYYIPLAHSYLGAPVQLSLSHIREHLLPALNRQGLKIIGHNIKFDLLTLFFSDLHIDNEPDDTMIIAHLLDSSQRLSLDELCLKYLNYREIAYEEVTTQGKKKLNFSEVEIETATKYSGEDAESSLRLYHRLYPLLLAKANLKRLYETVERPLIKVLFKMERTGVLVDGKILGEQNRILSQELEEVRKQVYTSAGEEFNIASPKQLGTVLFDKLSIPYPKKRKAGTAYSTAEEILSEIAPDYDIANLVLRYRELAKLISTYTEKLQTLISSKTGRIHTSFNQSGTVTGRLSSSDPNLQNIPARTKEGKLIRKAFIAPPGYKLLSADYSQIELRLIAHIAEDEGLIKAFVAGYDIHRATASEVLGKPLAEVTDQERSNAKATNFGLMYGMGAFGLRRQTHMSLEEAKKYIDSYFKRYPSVLKYMEKTRQEAHRNGYVLTICGREVRTPNINASSSMLSKAAERAAINAPMQGSAADIIKLAMVKIDRWIDTLPVGAVRMTGQVHDELLFEVRDDYLTQAEQSIRTIMENVVELKVPLTVGMGSSDNWGDAH